MIEKKTVSMCSTSEYYRGWNDAADTYQFHPIPADDVLDNVLVTPCWIEIKRESSPCSEFIADVLDQDSIGYFGKLDTMKRNKTRYFYARDYNRKWRCWREYVSLADCLNVKWEGEE